MFSLSVGIQTEQTLEKKRLLLEVPHDVCVGSL